MNLLAPISSAKDNLKSDLPNSISLKPFEDVWLCTLNSPMFQPQCFYRGGCSAYKYVLGVYKYAPAAHERHSGHMFNLSFTGVRSQ